MNEGNKNKFNGGHYVTHPIDEDTYGMLYTFPVLLSLTVNDALDTCSGTCLPIVLHSQSQH